MPQMIFSATDISLFGIGSRPNTLKMMTDNASLGPDSLEHYQPNGWLFMYDVYSCCVFVMSFNSSMVVLGLSVEMQT